MSHFDPHAHLHYLNDIEAKARAQIGKVDRGNPRPAFEPLRLAAKVMATVICVAVFAQVGFGFFV